MEDLALAVDIGGTKLAAALVTTGGDVVVDATVPTPRHDEADELFRALSAMVERVVSQVPTGATIAVCGVGCGGPMSIGGHDVSPLNIPAWRRFPLRDRLAASTGLACFVDNDAKALALGEGWRGAAAGVRNYIAMVVSTGIGGGIVVDGRLLDGRGGNAGHIGHVIVVPEGRLCGCGARGCLEAEASGPSIEAITGRPAAEADDDTKRRTGRLVGLAVANAATLLDLPLAVVAGSVALGFGDVFFDAAQAELDRHCRISFSRGARIVPAGLGSAGPLVGAGAVGWRGLATQGRGPWVDQLSR